MCENFSQKPIQELPSGEGDKDNSFVSGRQPPLGIEYSQLGWYGNNATIPWGEKADIAASNPDLPTLDGDRAVYRGQEAVHHFYQEQGIAPEKRSHDDWMMLMGHDMSGFCIRPHPTFLPFSDQRKMRGRGRVSKNERNLKKSMGET